MSLPLAPAEQRDLILSVSTHQGERRLSPVEVAELFRRALDAGASAQACAEAVGLSGPTMVRRFLRLLELSPEHREMVSWGRSGASISFTAGAEVARLSTDSQRYLIPEALRVGLTASELKAITQRLLRSDRTAEQAVEEILKTRPRIERRHVFVGRLGADESFGALASAGEEQRGQALRDLIIGRYSVTPLATRLTRSGFVITADDELAHRLHGETDFEATIIEALRASA